MFLPLATERALLTVILDVKATVPLKEKAAVRPSASSTT